MILWCFVFMKFLLGSLGLIFEKGFVMWMKVIMGVVFFVLVMFFLSFFVVGDLLFVESFDCGFEVVVEVCLVVEMFWFWLF